MSSTKSEMNTLSYGEQESQWLKFLIEELWKKKLAPTLFSIDNKGLLEKLKNFGSNSKTKHLDIKIKSLREKFKQKDIDVQLISSDSMVADALTKTRQDSQVFNLLKIQPQELLLLLFLSKIENLIFKVKYYYK
ncbi:hypothetical protein PGTUg99_035156 [Puccinia graminis f. sp. tritici]|uniref:Uncharacterized protein n=1 Tax=Puccinia graminis f. sp. tritici TaxID=56615 RepID=A0A5B0MFI1_PUCGR|nr:hypothetical protein PGTUg99_035156 [Puccinia graminis f. sp. tritici]